MFLSLSFNNPTKTLPKPYQNPTIRAAGGRLKGLDAQLKDLKKEQATLTQQWQGEKEQMNRLQSTREEIERVNLEIQVPNLFQNHLTCMINPSTWKQ